MKATIKETKKISEMIKHDLFLLEAEPKAKTTPEKFLVMEGDMLVLKPGY